MTDVCLDGRGSTVTSVPKGGVATSVMYVL